jgi:hypothetical protein
MTGDGWNSKAESGCRNKRSWQKPGQGLLCFRATQDSFIRTHLPTQVSWRGGCKLSVLFAEIVGRYVLYITSANIGYILAFSLLQ